MANWWQCREGEGCERPRLRGYAGCADHGGIPETSTPASDDVDDVDDVDGPDDVDYDLDYEADRAADRYFGRM